MDEKIKKDPCKHTPAKNNPINAKAPPVLMEHVCAKRFDRYTSGRRLNGSL